MTNSSSYVKDRLDYYQSLLKQREKMVDNLRQENDLLKDRIFKLEQVIKDLQNL